MSPNERRYYINEFSNLIAQYRSSGILSDKIIRMTTIFKRFTELMPEAVENEGFEKWSPLIASMYMKGTDFVTQNEAGNFNECDETLRADFIRECDRLRTLTRNMLVGNPHRSRHEFVIKAMERINAEVVPMDVDE